MHEDSFDPALLDGADIGRSDSSEIALFAPQGTEVSVPAKIIREIRSGQPISTPTYEGLMLQISLATDAFDAANWEALGLKIEDLSRVANNWDAEVQGRHFRLAAKYYLALYLLETKDHRAKGGAGQHKSKVSSQMTACEPKALTLEELNVTRNESSRLQKMAAEVSKDQFFKELNKHVAKGERLPTIGSIMRAAGVGGYRRPKARKSTAETSEPYEADKLLRATARAVEAVGPRECAIFIRSKKKQGKKQSNDALQTLFLVFDELEAMRRELKPQEPRVPPPDDDADAAEDAEGE